MNSISKPYTKRVPSDPVSNPPDPVSNPQHYTEGRGHQPLDVIEDWGLDFHLGNVLKYISRAGRKDSMVQDLNKAMYYLSRRVDMEERKGKQK
tara:strand:- start:131 stop:409 length:279 start_codon:yes stop_codon:yes gene_type:complete